MLQPADFAANRIESRGYADANRKPATCFGHIQTGKVFGHIKTHEVMNELITPHKNLA
jgi:hypothetical protein